MADCIGKKYLSYGATGRWVPCTNTARYGEYCGVHAPEQIAARKAKRGPTRFEREIAGIRARKEKLDALLAAARKVVDPKDFTHGKISDLAEALKAYD
jgi:hypothetical protein